MTRRLAWALCAFLFLIPCPLSLLHAQRAAIDLEAPSPPPVPSVGASYSGPAGLNTYYYWVVANYPIGKSGVAGPALLTGVGTLSGGNTARVSWQAAQGASDYDVLRTTSPFFPNGTNSIAVATGVSATTTTDDGSALSSYSLTSVSPALGQVRINNRDAANPRVELVLNGTVVVGADSTGIVVGGGAGDVTAASNFGTDNVLIRSDGTTKGLQASGVTIDDSDNVDVPGTLTIGAAGSATPVSWEGATVDANDVVVTITDPTAPRTLTVPDADSVVPVGKTCNPGDFVSEIDPATGVITCSTPAGSSGYDPLTNYDTAYFEDEFPCTAAEDGEGMLPWGIIGNPNPNGCAAVAGRPTGSWVLRPNTGNAIFGVRLGAASGNTGQLSSDPSSLDFESIWRIKIEDTSEVFYRIGWAVDAYAENYDYTASGGFIGIQFQSNTANCNSVESDTSWQAVVRQSTNSSGKQSLSVAPSTSVYLWVRIRRTATPGVEVCIDSTNSAPDFSGAGSGCYEETNAANIPTSGAILAPTMIASSCDGGTLTHAGLWLDRFAGSVKRF